MKTINARASLIMVGVVFAALGVFHYARFDEEEPVLSWLLVGTWIAAALFFFLAAWKIKTSEP